MSARKEVRGELESSVEKMERLEGGRERKRKRK